MPTIITRGAASAQALGYASSSAAVNYIEDVFSTYLYSGNSSTQTITNGIDLSGKGGLVWIKQRTGTQNHSLFDTSRGAGYVLNSDDTAGQYFNSITLTGFSSSGFSLLNSASVNTSTAGATYASWTFREQPKFFDVVTYTGNGAASRLISHQLGSVPGAVFIKRTSGSGGWSSLNRANATQLYLWPSNAFTTAASDGIQQTANFLTSTTFEVGSNNWPSIPASDVNDSGATYVAYLFAHDAGGFGLTGTDNVISCGSFTTDGSGNATVSLGYEPQWLMTKCATDPGFGTNWSMLDTMRGWTASAGLGNVQANLIPNLANAESNNNQFQPNATGFNVTGSFASSTIIYIAIRRGPMAVPTDATKVYANSTRSATAPAWTSNFPVDWFFQRTTSVDNWATLSRLTGTNQLRFNTTDAATTATEFKFDFMNGINGSLYADSTDYGWMMRRAPGFFDEVCYTGSNGFQDLSHNLGVTPQMIIIKNRTSVQAWNVGVQGILGTGKYLVLNTTAAVVSDANYYGSPWTSTTFLVDGNLAPINQSGSTYVAYLFATVAGVSKVGSYTGTGTTLQINCGFTAGSRFVLIKRTDSTGDWYVWDSARGIVAGNDPYLLLNSTAAEVTGTDYVDTYSAGFEISSTAPAAINASGGSFLFLAIA